MQSKEATDATGSWRFLAFACSACVPRRGAVRFLPQTPVHESIALPSATNCPAWPISTCNGKDPARSLQPCSDTKTALLAPDALQQHPLWPQRRESLSHPQATPKVDFQP